MKPFLFLATIAGAIAVSSLERINASTSFQSFDSFMSSCRAEADLDVTTVITSFLRNSDILSRCTKERWREMNREVLDSNYAHTEMSDTQFRDLNESNVEKLRSSHWSGTQTNEFSVIVGGSIRVIDLPREQAGQRAEKEILDHVEGFDLSGELSR